MPSLDPESIRNDFPILAKLIYLDNAATSLSPRQVVEAQVTAEYHYRANVGRGIHRLSRMATHQYQDARETVRQFLGGGQGTLVFTKNTTEATNIVAHGLNWKKTDRITTVLQDHHSNLLPWYQLKNEGKVAGIDTVPLNDGVIESSDIEACIMPETRLVAVGHASNVFGTITPVKAIAEICRDHDVALLIDGAQTAPHLHIDLEEIGCDFFCFSGHKMLGPMGTGGLWISDAVSKENIPRPLFAGGGMVASVEGTAFTPVTGPGRYEAGTPMLSVQLVWLQQSGICPVLVWRMWAATVQHLPAGCCLACRRSRVSGCIPRLIPRSSAQSLSPWTVSTPTKLRTSSMRPQASWSVPVNTVVSRSCMRSASTAEQSVQVHTATTPRMTSIC